VVDKISEKMSIAYHKLLQRDLDIVQEKKFTYEPGRLEDAKTTPGSKEAVRFTPGISVI
jgi:hypothetical protein